MVNSVKGMEIVRKSIGAVMTMAVLVGAAACGGGEDGANPGDPVLEEAPSVPPGGTGPGNAPVEPGIPLGGESRGPGAPISGESGDSVSSGPAGSATAP